MHAAEKGGDLVVNVELLQQDADQLRRPPGARR